MRDLRDYSVADWLKLQPATHAFKQLRNDLVQEAYLRQSTPRVEPFLEEVSRREGCVLAQIIAFEQPWALDWVLRSGQRHLADATIVVLDNSRNPSRRAEVEQVCRARSVPYLALPRNGTRHVNRHHGMALSWAFRNITRALKPESFGFFDHDLIPLERISLRERLGEQPFYGVLKSCRWGWHLWAGYSLFRYDAVRDLPLNFLYDFSADLDTGGRNWQPLYRHYDRASLRLGEARPVRLTVPGTDLTGGFEVVDNEWLHLCGIGYGNSFATRAAYFQQLSALTDQGWTLGRLLNPGRGP